ncbi:hypothetical protein ScPMuIL_002069 [Solemya velum]
MFSTPGKSKPRHDPVFRTPMTYSPRLVGNKPVPSPSRAEIWKEQLGLNDDPCPSFSSSDSTDEEDMENQPEQNPISAVEYRALQRELEERNAQRDDLMFRIKTLSDRTKHYKTKLEKDDAAKKQQIKILRKTQETQLFEKDTLINNLQSLAEEQEDRILQLEMMVNGNVHQPTPIEDGGNRIRSLCNEIKELQAEKVELTSGVEELKTRVETWDQENNEQSKTLQQRIVKLEAEIDELNCQISYHKNSQQMDSALYSTDTEKELEVLQSDNKRLLEEVIDLRRRQTNDATEKQYEEEISSLKQKLSKCEAELMKKEKELKASDEKKQMVVRQMREVQAENIGLQARDPEVVTKIKRVEVQVESENLKRAYVISQESNTSLKSQIMTMQQMCNDTNQQLTAAQIKNSHLQGQLKDTCAQKESEHELMKREFEALENSKEAAIQAVREQMTADTRALKCQYMSMCQKMMELQMSFKEVAEEYKHLKSLSKQFPQVLSNGVKQVRKEICKAIGSIDSYNKELVQKYHREMMLRKKYHNELVELKGNIRVFCRVRPKIKEDGGGTQAEQVVSYDRDDDGLVYVTNKGRNQTFEIDKVFTEQSSQIEVFDEMKPLVTSCLDGYNVCIFAYGQTGSGKTYTMEGPRDNPGINQRALQLLFEMIAEKGIDWSYTITVSVMEIYNEIIRDLLNEDTSCKMEVKMSAEGGLYVPGLTYYKVESVDDVYQVFAVGQKNRATASTSMNEHSSRSHALLNVTVTGINMTTNTKITGKLNLVDLAGSERVSKSGADGARLREAQNINKSLSCLGDVIHALRSKQNHVPYRNSKLTYLLQDSLGGDSKTLMIVQVAPVEKNVGETLCSLNFAQRVRSVELGAASKRVENGDIANEYDETCLGSPHVKQRSPKNPATPSSSNHFGMSRPRTPASSSKSVTPSSKVRQK